MLKKLTIVAAAAAALASTHAAAQVAPAQVQQLAPGTRVRVSTIARDVQVETRDPSRRQWRIGTVREVTEQDLVLQTDPSRPDALETVPFGVIQEIDASRGRLDVGRSVRRGMLQGAAGGGLTALVFTGIKVAIGSCSSNAPGCRHGVLRTGLGASARDMGVGLVGGALVGALAGSRSREVWQPVARHATVSAYPAGGTGIGLSFRI